MANPTESPIEREEARFAPGRGECQPLSQFGSAPRSGKAQAGLLLVLAAAVSGLALAFVSGALHTGWESLLSLLGRKTEAPAIDASSAQADGAPSLIPSEGAPATSASLEAEPDPGSSQSSFDRNERAVKAINEGRLDEAIELLKAAIAENGDVAAYHMNLATAYVRRARSRNADEFELARADFEAALAHSQDEERSGRIRTWMGRAETIAREEAEFSIEQTLHYTFKFDASRTEIRGGVDLLQVLLEDTYQEYGELFGRRPVEAGEEKIAVVLYGSEGFNNVTGLGDWAGGAFDGTIRVPADDLRDPRRVARLRDVLRHEVAHAFCQSIGGREVPSWLNEGIAQWLENPARRGAGLKVARARLVNARDSGGKELFKLAQVQGSLVSWSDTAEITRAYDQALAFVDYLAEQYGARLLFDLVAECKTEGIGGAEVAFERQILVDLNVVLQDFASNL